MAPKRLTFLFLGPGCLGFEGATADRTCTVTSGLPAPGHAEAQGGSAETGKAGDAGGKDATGAHNLLDLPNGKP